MNPPLTSVLITAYNREKYIAEAIESVLASTYTNFELIVVDDCSTDNTVTIARSYLPKDSRISVYVNDTNLTQFGNRNKAASLATGDYLKYVDSDDIIYPHTLQMMVSAMQSFPNAALGFCLKDSQCKMPLPYQIESVEAYRQHFFEGGLLFIGPSGLIIKRAVFEQVGGFEEFGMPSDNHLTLKIAAQYPVVALARDLFWWRVHEGQVFMQNKKNDYSIENNYNYVRDVLTKYSPLPDSENKKLLKIYKRILVLHTFRMMKRGKPGIALKILNRLKVMN